MPVASPGDLFSFPIGPEEVGFGQVMLNIQMQCIDAGLLDADSTLVMYENTVLLDIFRETSATGTIRDRTPMIRGLLTGSSLLAQGEWRTLAHEPVRPQDVAFPQTVAIESNTEGAFCEGELKVVADFSYEDVQQVGVTPRTIAAVRLGETVLYELGRADEINCPGLVDVSLRSLARYDLRFSEHKARVYEAFGIDPDEPYYERAKSLGFDLARFYS